MLNKWVYVDLYSAIPWNGDISNALMSLMSGKEMRFQVPPKVFRFDGRIAQRIWQLSSKPSGIFTGIFGTAQPPLFPF